MAKAFDIVFTVTVGAVAVTATVYAVMTGMSIPIWAILAFIFAVGGISVLVINSTKRIHIKYFDPSLPPVNKITVGDWIDLRSAERVELKKGETYLIPLGVGMILPVGYEALVLPRSSTHAKFGIMCANSMGVIDNSYSGENDEWKFPAIAIRDTVIEKGDRIAQFRIVENQPKIKFNVVAHLRKRSRGGIGSTGTK